MYCTLPGSSVHGILLARILEWVAISFSRGSSQPKDWTWVSCGSYIAGRFFTHQENPVPSIRNANSSCPIAKVFIQSSKMRSIGRYYQWLEIYFSNIMPIENPGERSQRKHRWDSQLLQPAILQFCANVSVKRDLGLEPTIIPNDFWWEPEKKSTIRNIYFKWVLIYLGKLWIEIIETLFI